jgi:hypothetical protein
MGNEKCQFKGGLMPLDEKARLKLDKVFMAFGSLMHALERNAGGKE